MSTPLPPDSLPPVLPPPEAGESGSLLGALRYGASLPERLVRSAAGLTAGTAKELAEFVVPRSFQDSKTYEVMVRNSLSFLISNIGGIEDKNAAKTPPPEDYIARKAVGNFMDFAGLATLHLSPLWVLAAVSDVAYGTRTYVHELARELQAQGLIDDASTIHHIDDVLTAVQQASGTAASTLDQPPLSVDALKASIEQTREALAGANPLQLIPEAELERMWSGMKSLAEQEKVSLLGVSGAVALQTLAAAKTVTQGTLTSVVVAGQIINRTVFSYYAEALSRVHQQGLFKSVRDTYEPYVEGVWKNFQSDRRTWTDAVLDGSALKTAWTGVRKLFGSEAKAE